MKRKLSNQSINWNSWIIPQELNSSGVEVRDYFEAMFLFYPLKKPRSECELKPRETLMLSKMSSHWKGLRVTMCGTPYLGSLMGIDIVAHNS